MAASSICLASVRDGLGNRLAVAYPNGVQVISTYDAVERLKTVTDDQALLLATYFYIGKDRTLARLSGNGIQTDYSYNADRVLDGIKIDGGTLADWEYTVVARAPQVGHISGFDGAAFWIASS